MRRIGPDLRVIARLRSRGSDAMFTGIVAAKGSVRAAVPTGQGGQGDDRRGRAGSVRRAVGDSIAVDGCCLTVVELAADAFAVDVSQETHRLHRRVRAGRAVNLEKALRLSDRLGGHLVSGHVDGVGEVTRFEPVGESWLLEVRAPRRWPSISHARARSRSTA